MATKTQGEKRKIDSVQISFDQRVEAKRKRMVKDKAKSQKDVEIAIPNGEIGWTNWPNG